MLSLCFVGGCGTVGPPVAPEYVGVGAKLQREKEIERAKEEERRKALQRPEGQPAEPGLPPIEPEAGEAAEEEVTLPPLRPIGTSR